MKNTLWRCPAPSSSFDGVQLLTKPRREIALRFRFEDQSGRLRNGELSFNDVVHYRTTYWAALRADQIDEAYDRLIDCTGDSDHAEVVAATLENGDGTAYQHYRICFDDGPAFDFFCRSFSYAEDTQNAA